MSKKTKRIPLFLTCSLILIPLGCGGQPAEVELNLRVDDTPIERESGSPVNSYAAVLRDIQPAVVSVYSQRMVEEGLSDHPVLRQFFGGGESRERMQRGVGSGVIISPEGYVLTNNHVVEGADRIIVQFADESRVEAEVVGTDPPTDIAVLRLSESREGEYPSVVLADSDLVEVGDVVFALGNALGIGHAVTSGIVSARGRTGIGILGDDGYEDFIQTDAPMNIGNSGGPLVDSKGRVLGINTAIASPGGGNVGIGFAIPINMARNVMEHLIEFGEVRRGYLGISLRDSSGGAPMKFGAPDRGGDSSAAGREGALVVDVVEDSPAAAAGLQEGDSVVELNGREIDSASDLRLEVARLRPGTPVEIGLVRDGERLNVSATLGDLREVEVAQEQQEVTPPAGDELLPGLMASPLTPELRQQLGLPSETTGLIVTGAEEGSPYAEVFPPGAIIVQINEENVTDVAGAREKIQPGRNLFLLFYRGVVHHVVVEVNER